MSNILKAFHNLVLTPIPKLVTHYSGKNRANSMGDALECYVKDLFASSVGNSAANALAAHQQVFAYLGNQNNPPDMILNGGDAIEVKKIGNLTADLALNSSYPKDFLYSSSSMLTNACKQSDGGNWQFKDIVYAVGVAHGDDLQGLWFVYGDCYAADCSVYENLKTNIMTGISHSPNVQLATTKELARVNKVDPLGITYLRVRGMWGIDNPINVFTYLNLTTDASFFSHVIMKRSKFDSFPNQDKINLINLSNSNQYFYIQDLKISSPNNPALSIDVKIFSFIIP
jgi:hypothetical protein